MKTLLIILIAAGVGGFAWYNSQHPPSAAEDAAEPTVKATATPAAQETRAGRLEKIRLEGNAMFGPPRAYAGKVLDHFGNNLLLMRGQAPDGDFVLEGHPHAGGLAVGEIFWFDAWNTGPHDFTLSGGGYRTLDRYAYAIEPQKVAVRATPRPYAETNGLTTRVGINTYIERPVIAPRATPTAAEQAAEIARKYGAAR